MELCILVADIISLSVGIGGMVALLVFFAYTGIRDRNTIRYIENGKLFVCKKPKKRK